jgi:hypothetical protein
MSLKPPQILAPRSLLRAEPVVNTLAAEFFEEKAATLGRLARAFESALAAWRAMEEEAAAGLCPSERRRRRLLDEAADALWHFVVQREACGLKNTEAVLREYRVPAALRLRMGAIRRG